MNPIKILIVDDMPVINELISSVLLKNIKTISYLLQTTAGMHVD